MSTTITAKIRDLINDNYRPIIDIFEYTTSNIFTLNYSAIDESSINVLVDGVAHNGSGNWSYDSATGQLTVDGLPSGTAIIEVRYNAYKKYSEAELEGYTRAAFIHLSVEQYKIFTQKCSKVFPTPSEAEENLIALVASLLITNSVRSYRTPEFTINFDESVSVDTKIKQSIKKFKQYYGILDYVDLADKVVSEEED